MKFIYSATEGQSKNKTSGVVSAANRPAAIRQLKERGLVVLSLTLVKEQKEYYLGSVSATEKVILTKHLAIMLQAGVSLDEALQVLEAQSRGRMKEIILKIHEDVTSGELLATALSKFPRVFNDYYINMIRAGEQSGNLVANLELLGKQFAKDYELRKKSQSAMIYPGLIFSMTVGLGIIIAIFVLPRLSKMFQAFQFELPWTTRALIAVANFVRDFGILSAVLAVLFLVGIVFFARFKKTKRYFHWLYLHLPVVKLVSHDVNLARFATVLGSLRKSGLPITSALATTAQVLGNEVYRQSLRDAIAAMDQGENLSLAMERTKIFPLFVSRMIGIGERTGNLEQVLEYLQDYYDNELDNVLKNLSTILEPAMLLIIGGLVALVAFSIITPIYNFVGAVG